MVLRLVSTSGRPRRRGLLVWFTLASVVAVTIGCEVDRVPFIRLVEGKKFLAAGDPFRAADLFRDSMEREKEKETLSEARAHIAVAHDRAMRKVAGIPSERAKYSQMRAADVQLIAGDPTAIAHLIRILEYHNLSSVSSESILVELGAVAVSPLLSSYSMRPDERNAILRVLASIGGQIVPGIRSEVFQGELIPDEQAGLVRLLGLMPAADTIDTLREIVGDASVHEGVRTEALAALYRQGHKHDRDQLLAALNSRDTLVRRAASFGMSYLNEAPDPQTLVAHLSDEDAAVRLNIVEALGVHRSDSSVVPALLATLRQDENNNVANACGRSAALYGAGIIDRVVDALTSEEDWTRRQRLVRLLSSEHLRSGYTQDQEFRIYEFFQKQEDNADVKADLAQFLKDMESE